MTRVAERVVPVALLQHLRRARDDVDRHFARSRSTRAARPASRNPGEARRRLRGRDFYVDVLGFEPREFSPEDFG